VNEVRAASGHCQALARDLAGEESTIEYSLEIETAAGAVTVLKCNAGTFFDQSASDTTSDRFRQLWNISCLGVSSAQAAANGMLNQQRGTIYPTGAIAAVCAGAKAGAFAASRIAPRAQNQSMVRKYGPHGIRMAPTSVDAIVDTTRRRSTMETTRSRRKGQTP